VNAFNIVTAQNTQASVKVVADVANAIHSLSDDVMWVMVEKVHELAASFRSDAAFSSIYVSAAHQSSAIR